ncbi:MAG TPA: hypothetical protein V6D19_23815 [Stenomitos sp.]
MKDYIVFIHGVNTREVVEEPTYAEDLFEKISRKLEPSSQKLISIPLYWGNVNIKAEKDLLSTMELSPLWQKMWFRDFRSKQILQFVGDAALYISRAVGAQVVQQIKEQALQGLSGYTSEDRMHLITHSWGTVILFDILFASRWDDINAPGHQDVMQIRNAIFGIEGDVGTAQDGVKLASLHTMGSPIAIFSLTDIAQPDEDNAVGLRVQSTHDITPKLQDLLQALSQARQGKKLTWRNFIHPGDPVAYPLKELLMSMVDPQGQSMEFQDILTHNASLFDFLNEPLSQTALALLHGGDAHGSYWHSDQVAEAIAQAISHG